MNSGAGGGAASRVSIPSNVRETIRQIKEITGNHSEEEIYAMLKECSMDPNETTQKLLFQDTFHEVKKKRDRKKENMNKGFAKPNWKPGMQGCWNKGGHGNYPSRYASHDSGRGKNSGKENQTSQMLEKSISRTSVPTLREEKSISSLSIALPNGSSSGSSGSDAGDVSGKLEGQQCPAPTDARKSPKVGQCTRDTHGHPSLNASNTATSTALVPSSRAYFSTSDPVLLSSQDSQSIGTVEGLRCELGSQHVPVKHAPSDSNDSKTPSASIAKDWKLKAANANSAQASDAGTSAELSMVSVEAQTEMKPRPDVMELQKKLEESMNILEVRHVIIPSHFQVPEAEKLGFCFGSFDANYYLDTNSNNVPQEDKKPLISKTTEHIEETAREQFPRNESELTTVDVDVDVAEDFDHPQLSSHGLENPPSKGDEVLPSAPEYKILKQESVHGGQQHSALHTSPNYSFGFMPPKLGSQVQSFESFDSQTSDVSCPPNFVGGSHLVSSTAAATPLVTQLSGLMESSIGVTQPPLPLFRQPTGVHLPHYIPYGHYFLPFYIAPLTIQQLLSNGSLPQQPLAGSLYPPPPPAVAKYLPSQFKQGSNSANLTHIGAPGNYGPHDSTANYNPASATVGNPSSNDENSASQFKASSFYSFPQGQVAFSTPPQPVHGAVSGLYHPVPPVTSPTVHPLLQQSQSLAGPLDIVGPAASIYHQPLHSHINWPSSY